MMGRKMNNGICQTRRPGGNGKHRSDKVRGGKLDKQRENQNDLETTSSVQC